MSRNPILDTDSYKLSHPLQYPGGTTQVSSYIEPRGGNLPEVVFFGLQAFLRELPRVTAAHVEEAAELAQAHIGTFDRAGWDRIVNVHGGRLPLEIQALPEGLVVPTRIPVVQVRNTDPALPWLPGHFETALLRAVWYPTTVASLSFACKRVLGRYLDDTSDDPAAVLPFQLHDFGARGATGNEAAGLGGAAHLVNFRGTDTLAALLLARRHYFEPMAGHSIPASEHATMTSWGRTGEAGAYGNMLARFGGDGRTLAFVVDSYDLWHAVDQIVGVELKERIQTSGGRVVIRPDSGDPVAVVPRVVEHLMAAFGARTNGKGYRVLPDCIRVIQGDGITLESLPRILEALKLRGLATENVAFGMGAGLLQKVDRDTMKWAMKASQAVVGWQPRDICKDPVTDPGKRSRAGRWAVVAAGGGYEAVREEALGERTNLLRTVFRDGELLATERFADIRARAQARFDALRAIEARRPLLRAA